MVLTLSLKMGLGNRVRNECLRDPGVDLRLYHANENILACVPMPVVDIDVSGDGHRFKRRAAERSSQAPQGARKPG